VSKLLVARPTPKSCRVCALPAAKRQEVNAAIWQGDKRVAAYIVAGKRAFEAASGGPINSKTITRHALHIEASMRAASVADPATSREEPVFKTDYETVVERAATVGMKAMTELERMVVEGEVGTRELVAIAKMGVTARAQQRATEVDAKRPQVLLMGIFGLASGHLAQLPESEAVGEVIEESALRLEVQQERKLLEARARG
jgi:hypothetical protein